MPVISISIPDEVYQQIRNTDLAVSAICQDALRDEIYHRRVLTSPRIEMPRTFSLQRNLDVSGISGTGIVAHGVRWPDGAVALRWVGARPSTVHWSCLSDPIAIHGHDGATEFLWHPTRAWHCLSCEAVTRECPECGAATGGRPEGGGV